MTGRVNPADIAANACRRFYSPQPSAPSADADPLYGKVVVAQLVNEKYSRETIKCSLKY